VATGAKGRAIAGLGFTGGAGDDPPEEGAGINRGRIVWNGAGTAGPAGKEAVSSSSSSSASGLKRLHTSISSSSCRTAGAGESAFPREDADFFIPARILMTTETTMMMGIRFSKIKFSRFLMSP
jgi:hypothetical protein